MNNFSQLGLPDPIIKAISELGFEMPSKIQEQAIPSLISKEIDFIGLAQTGTGKTGAFGLPLLDKVDVSQDYTQALVLAPTRELGQQIGIQLKAFGKYINGLKIETVYGGAPIQGQIKSIKSKSPQIIIATPGRLLDLMKRKVIDISRIRTLVLDEADEMLNMGFKEDIDTILSHTSGESVIWLFSATMPKEIRSIINTYMVDPLEVKVTPKNEMNENISHHYYLINREDKTEAIIRLLHTEPEMVGIIFCRTKIDTQRLADDLCAQGYPVEALHGDLNQNQRDRVMQKFRSHKVRLITATDVAARGIDVKNVTHVIHHSLPDDAAYYTHRSGRTARAGEKGVSVSLATRGDLRKLSQFDQRLKLGLQQSKVPSATDIAQRRLYSWVERVKSIDGLPDKTISEEVEAQFSSLSKSELVERLVALELSGWDESQRDLDIQHHTDHGKDRESSDRFDGGRRKDRRNKSHFQNKRNKSGNSGNSVNKKRRPKFSSNGKWSDKKKG